MLGPVSAHAQDVVFSIEAADLLSQAEKCCAWLLRGSFASLCVNLVIVLVNFWHHQGTILIFKSAIAKIIF